MLRGLIIVTACSTNLLLAATLRADSPAAPKYDAEIAPLFAQHCQQCHGPRKPKSGLDLTSAAGMLRGGESGPAIVPGQADKSLLVEMIASGQMPPEGEAKLTEPQIDLVRRWVASGALAGSGEPSEAAPAIDPAARSFRAFQPLAAPSVPPLADTAQTRTPVDAFILARLASSNLRLSPEADRLALLRRASFDLLGLPPAPEEIDAFLTDDRADAYERLIDRLLASPHFGQRWGRHWLDAAGYSDITGGDNDASIIKLSEGKWKYRDYVVRAFNDDKPYERFLIEQLAGDELVDWRGAKQFTSETREMLVATGFLRNAADDTDEKELTTPDILHGILQRTGEVVANNLLGLTLACAKCHDHKYEPISQQDYYRLLAAFTPTFNPTAWVPPKSRALADISPAEKAEGEAHNVAIDRQIAEIKQSQADVTRPIQERIFATKLATLSEPIRADVKVAIETAADKRNEVQKDLAEKFKAALAVSGDEVNAALGPDEMTKLAAADKRIAELHGTRRTWGTIQAAYDVGPPPATHLLRRGNHETPGPALDPGFLSMLCTKGAGNSSSGAPLGPASLKPAGQTSGRRLALALWLTDWRSPAGALAARVMVNRVWQHLFGRGIVETSENLGISGAEPTHPDLLEWLACRFVSEGRQVKPLIRLLMTSAVYRQASGRTGQPGQAVADALKVDPANRMLWHMPLRRLEAEIVRDAILAAGGQLDLSLGGASLPLEVRSDGMVVIQVKGPPTPEAKARRSLYVLARRNYHLSMLGVFDQPSMSTNCPNRQQSAVVLQSLTMLNDDSVLDAAEHFARRISTLAADRSGARPIELAFRIALGRNPSAAEIAWSQDLLREHGPEVAEANSPDGQQSQKALTHLCHMLLNSNEFLYVP